MLHFRGRSGKVRAACTGTSQRLVDHVLGSHRLRRRLLLLSRAIVEHAQIQIGHEARARLTRRLASAFQQVECHLLTYLISTITELGRNKVDDILVDRQLFFLLLLNKEGIDCLIFLRVGRLDNLVLRRHGLLL